MSLSVNFKPNAKRIFRFVFILHDLPSSIREIVKAEIPAFLDSSVLLIKRLSLISFKEFLFIFYTRLGLHFYCKKQTKWTVKSTTHPAPQMATIVTTTNNKLTITFMLTTFYSRMQKPCKISRPRLKKIIYNNIKYLYLEVVYVFEFIHTKMSEILTYTTKYFILWG